MKTLRYLGYLVVAAVLACVSLFAGCLCREAHADLIKQSTAYNRTVLMTSTSDHITGATGLTLTVSLSKNGAAFASVTPIVTELSGGRYKIALTSGNTDTLNALDMQITATGADPSDTHDQVVAFDPGDPAALGLSRIDAAVSTRQSGSVAVTLPSTVLQAGDLTALAGAVTGASVLTSASNTGTSTPALTKVQADALMLATSVGNYDATAPVASGTATFRYYLVGRSHVSGNLVSTATVTYDANKVPVSRNVVVANPFPTVP